MQLVMAIDFLIVNKVIHCQGNIFICTKLLHGKLHTLISGVWLHTCIMNKIFTCKLNALPIPNNLQVIWNLNISSTSIFDPPTFLKKIENIQEQ